MRNSYAQQFWLIFIIFTLAQVDLQGVTLHRNPFKVLQYPQQHTVIATACIAYEDGCENATFVKLHKEVRCIKTKTPSTWES